MTFHVTPIFFRRGSPGYDEYGRLPPKNGGSHMKSHAASGQSGAAFFSLSGHKKINWNSIEWELPAAGGAGWSTGPHFFSERNRPYSPYPGDCARKIMGVL